MDILRLVLLVVIGGLIGYITNKVAIKMLFRPINPVRILGFTFQGVFPKRKDQMAISLAETIETELLNPEVILDELLTEEFVSSIKEDLKKTLIQKIQNIIPPMAKMFLGDNVDELIKKFIEKDGDTIFTDLIQKVKEQGKDQIDIHKLVKNKIDELDFEEFEKIIFGLMNRELRHIEVIGLVLGSIIGLVQYVVTIFI